MRAIDRQNATESLGKQRKASIGYIITIDTTIFSTAIGRPEA